MVFKSTCLLALISLLFLGCDKKYDIDINGSESKKEAVFNCGKVVIASYCVSRSHFFVKLGFDLQKTTFFYTDSLSIEFRGKTIPFELTNSERRVTDTELELNNGEDYKIEFTINDPLVNKGDVILIKDFGYLHCDNQKVEVGNIKLNIK